VEKYSQYEFDEAKACVEETLKIRELLLPAGHFQICAGKRVKALIIEEMALKTGTSAATEALLLDEALELQTEGLELQRARLGEHSLITAKYYGNLGRLYQTRHDLSMSEAMHKKAIAIKELILGPFDYEVALSIGHLASLFCFDMQRYAEAVPLYHRSIKIGLDLFGPTYSGLEYDFRGLMHAFHQQGDVANYALFLGRFNTWEEERKGKATADDPRAVSWVLPVKTLEATASVLDVAALSAASIDVIRAAAGGGGGGGGGGSDDAATVGAVVVVANAGAATGRSTPTDDDVAAAPSVPNPSGVGRVFHTDPVY
jgi:tetratricopeptide (TPR) repeat protein